MDILDLDESLKFTHVNGVALNIEQRFRLNLGIQSLLNKSSANDFEELMYWGRVDGLNAEYYIAMGVTYTDKFEFPEKRFYWASSADFRFKPFPERNDQHTSKVDSFRALFLGDPNFVLI